jgi:hypothetical protein
MEESKRQYAELELSLNNRRLASTSTCNLTRYKVWLNERYDGVLASDSKFWMYQEKPNIVLNNFFALNLAVSGCTRYLDSLYTYRSGRMGPVTVQDSYKIMCRDYCLENDAIHEVAMNVAGCSCLELSTQSSDGSYTKEGDWCRHNSARLLCDLVGYCGIWNCRIDDFMCPRYEWNKKIIPLIGPGSCIRGAAPRGIVSLGTFPLLLLIFVTSFVSYLV